MGKWPLVRLGDVGKIVTGSTPRTSDRSNYSSRDICFYKPGDFDEGKLNYLDGSIDMISENAREKVRMLPPNSVLVTCIGIIGKVGILAHEATCNQQINAIIPNFNVDSRALAYILLRNQAQLKEFANAPLVPIINKTTFASIKIPLPPLDIQKHIANTLDKTQEIIDGHKKTLAEFDDLIMAVFYELFGNPVTNDKGWETKLLADVAPLMESKFDTKGMDKVWLLNLDAIESNTGEVLEHKYVNPAQIGTSTIMFDETNVLYSKLRPYLNKVVIPNSKGIGTSELVPFKPKDGVINRIFLATLLRTQEFVTYISTKVAGAKMPRVIMSELVGFRTILPPLDLQNKFAEIVTKIEEQKALVKQAITESEHLFKSLMSEYFD